MNKKNFKEKVIDNWQKQKALGQRSGAIISILMVYLGFNKEQMLQLFKLEGFQMGLYETLSEKMSQRKISSTLEDLKDKLCGMWDAFKQLSLPKVMLP